MRPWPPGDSVQHAGCGLSQKIRNVLHHTLFFDSSFDDHAVEIYDEPAWPKDPLFYASFSSITDKSAAPENKEAATFLIPLAPDLEDGDPAARGSRAPNPVAQSSLLGRDAPSGRSLGEARALKPWLVHIF